MNRKEKTLHMIGNAHIDPVWLWNWQEGFQEVKATFRSALDRMREDPEFRFSCGSALFYEWVEHNHPGMFEEIRRRVAEGRWEIVGGWVVQPDCNLPCGESFARQGLYAQRYFRQKFGVTASTGFNPDSFGHCASLPQILRKSGMDSYVFMRPAPMEKGLPGRIFHWRGDDGSSVLACRLPYEYCSGGGDLEPYVSRVLPELEGEDDLMLFYGVGNHGGGPTRRNLESVHALNGREDLPALELSTTRRFFDAVRQNGREYPVVQGDLQHHASGCYSACSRVKRENRRTENLLLAAEKWSVVGKIAAGRQIRRDFTEAWKGVLFNQFHDVLAGSCIPSAYDDASYLYGGAMAAAQQNLNNAIQALSWEINIEKNPSMRPIVVFNPHAFEIRVPVELEVRGLRDDSFRLTDDNGNTVPAQRVRSEAAVQGQSRLLFIARLPSLGYRVYRLYLNQEVPPRFPLVSARETALENGRLRIELNPDSGFIRSLFDKRLGAELLRREGARLGVAEDRSDTWAHNVFRFDREIASMRPESIRLVEQGPVRSSIRVRYRWRESWVTQEFRLYQDLDEVEVKGRAEWREPFTLLKVHFPVRLDFRRAVYEIPYGHIERSANGEEEPGQSWVDFTGVHPEGKALCGLSLLNDGNYSFSMDVDDMAMTLLRNAVYAHHEPYRLEEDQEYRLTEEGVQEFTYVLLPHEGTWQDGGTVRRAAALNQKPFTVIETYHDGPRPQSDSFLRVDREEILIRAVKEAEDGDGIILRAVETAKQAVDCVISVPLLGREIPLHFGPCEIKTVKIPRDGALEALETDLLEDPVR